MSGQAPWQNGRRAWERLGGYLHPQTYDAAASEEIRGRQVAITRSGLKDMRLVRGLLGQAELGLVRRARQVGMGWGDIAAMLGVTREEAFGRWHEDGEQLS